MANDKPFTVEEQIDTMKKYVTFTKRARMRDFYNILDIFVPADMESICYHTPMYLR